MIQRFSCRAAIPYILILFFAPWPFPAAAQSVLNFEGLGNLQPIGTIAGATFSPNWLSINSCTAGGPGNFVNPPSGVGIAFILVGGPGTTGTITFSQPVSSVSTRYAARTSPLTLTAFDAAGNAVGTAIGPQTPFTFTGQCGVSDTWGTLSISSPSGPISSVSLHDAGNFFAIDDFRFSAIAMIDPVPDLLDGSSVTKDPNLLATRGRSVQGVVADGVTQVVLRIPATMVGQQFALSVIDDKNAPSSSTDDDGAVGNVGDDLTNIGPSTQLLSAVSTTAGPMAFAAYRAPVDFPRLSGTDSTASEREVSIKVRTLDANAFSFTVPVRILRPPILLIHGVWSSPVAWDSFCPAGNENIVTCNSPLDSRFVVFRIDYESTNGTEFLTNARIAFIQLRRYLDQFKSSKQVAAVQFDVVSHSMGGNIIETIVARINAFLRNSNYKKGDVHKFISLDTPHLGSPFANRLLDSNIFCRSQFNKRGLTVGGALVDLSTGSDAIRLIQQTMRVPILAHVIVGTASTAQEAAATQTAQDIWLTKACPSLLPQGGFRAVFGGDSDLIVSQSSQEAQGLAFSGVGSPPNTIFSSAIHSLTPPLFTVGPDVLSRNLVNGSLAGVPTGIPEDVIQFLNKSIRDPSVPFGAMKP